jgi:hypothetical protein
MTEPFKKDAGTKSIYETVTAMLRNDAVLKGLVNYTPKSPNIRRGFQPDGEWKSLVLYYLQTERVVADFDPSIRTVPLIVHMYTRENELSLYDISERVVQLLDYDGAEIDASKEGFCHVYSISYDAEMIGVSYDDTKQAFNRALRFILTFRKED